MNLFTIVIPLAVFIFIFTEYRGQKKPFLKFFKKFIRDYGTTLFIVLVLYTYIQYSSNNLIEGIDEKAKEENVKY